jgi:ATP-dependent DNA helicase RecQ
MDELQRMAQLTPEWDWAQAAVIGRDWKSLDPVRSYCEHHRIPVQMANEDTAQCWRLRETQQLVQWLHDRPGTLVDCAAIRQFLAMQPSGPWWSLLTEALDQYTLETGGSELPAAHFVEWLVEWGREFRRRQTGLLLLTAHSSKGLEFDHVAILDGGWNSGGHNEDIDAPRRLFYVAMTRARKTLTLLRMQGRHRLLEQLAEQPAVLVRDDRGVPDVPRELARRYCPLGPKDVDLSFAGRHRPNASVHRAIGALSPGDEVSLRRTAERWELCDRHGHVVGRLAKAYAAPVGMRFLSGQVKAVIVRRREDSEPEYQARLGCDRWEVVLPELVFEPEA